MTFRDIRHELLTEDPSDPAGQLLLGALERCLERSDIGDEELHDALAAGPWTLRSIRVSGFRGAANGTDLPGAADAPLRLDLPRTAPVVVVHAPNGAGKSTLADGLQVALYGGTAHAPAFGTPDLRRPVPLHKGARHASATVLLENDRGDTLRLQWSLAGGTDGTERCDVHWWTRGDPDTEHGRPGRHWLEAIRAHRPAVGYEELNHRLRDPAALREFLLDAFTLGSNWWDLRQVVAEEVARAEAARSSWREARDQVAVDLADVDEDLAAQHPETPAPAPLPLPRDPAEDVTGWFASVLGEDGDPLLAVHVDPDLPRLLADARHEAAGCMANYERLRRDSDQELWAGGALEALGRLIAQTDGHPGDRCPVCTSAVPDWRESARQTLDALRVVREEFNLVTVEFASLARLLSEELLPLVGYADGLAEVAGTAARLRRMIQPLAGRTAPVMGTARWRAVEQVLADENFDRDVQRVVAAMEQAGDVQRQWRAVRAQRCAPLLAAHREQGMLATTAPTWQQAADRLTAAYERVREERRQQLETSVGGPLRELLGDLGLADFHADLSGAMGAEQPGLRLDLGGRAMSTHTLSAGQYNALVLALLLGTETSGPFGFVVLDDPVHAFDDFRMDVLAKLVRRRGDAGRQVVLLTHDQRVVDVVRERVAGVCVIKMGRDEHGNVETKDVTHPWQSLVEDGRRLLTSNGTATVHVLADATLAVLVLGFCRQAVDAVLREATLALFHERGTPTDPLKELNKAGTTRNALKATRKRAGPGHPATTVIDALLADAAYLGDLNAATHTDVASLDLSPSTLRARLDRTAAFCEDLLRAAQPKRPA